MTLRKILEEFKGKRSTIYFSNYKIETYIGFSNPFFLDINKQNAFSPDGLFRNLIFEKDLPQIISIITDIDNDQIISWSILCDDSEFMGDSTHLKSNSLGFLGVYTKLKYRNLGYAAKNLETIDAILEKYILKNSDNLEKIIFVQNHVLYGFQKYMKSIKVLPIWAEEIPIGKIIVNKNEKNKNKTLKRLLTEKAESHNI